MASAHFLLLAFTRLFFCHSSRLRSRPGDRVPNVGAKVEPRAPVFDDLSAIFGIKPHAFLPTELGERERR